MGKIIIFSLVAMATESQYGSSFVQCQVDICGSSEENVTTGDIHNQITRIVEEVPLPTSTLNMLDRISPSYERKKKRLLGKLARLKKFFQGDHLAINQHEKRVLFSRLFFVLFHNSVASADSEHEDVLSTIKLLDQQSIRENIPPYINTQIIPYALKALEQISNHYHERRFYYGLENGSKELFMWENEGKNIQEVIDREAKAIAEKFQTMERMIDPSLEPEEITDVHSSMNVQILTERQVEDLFNNILVLNAYLELFFDDDLHRGLDSITTYDQFYNIQAVVNRIDMITQEVQEIEDDFSEELSKCRDIIKNNYKALPTKRELEAFKKRAEMVKKTAKEFVESAFSTDADPLLVPFFDDVTIKYPDISDHILENIEKEIESELEEEHEIGDSTIADDINSVIYWESVDDSFFDVCSHLENIFEINTESLEDRLRFTGDVKYNSNGEIKLSWQSVKNPEYGEVVLAHELGHHLGNFFENKHTSVTNLRKFQKVHHCLSKNQPETRYNSPEERKVLGRSDPVTYPVSQFAHEDFADLFSFLIHGKTAPNLGCFFIDDRGGYSDRDVFRPYRPDPNDGLIKHKDSDTIKHSTDFFRMLHLEFLRQDDLPRSCQNFLAKEDIPFYPEDCSRHFFF